MKRKKTKQKNNKLNTIKKATSIEVAFLISETKLYF